MKKFFIPLFCICFLGVLLPSACNKEDVYSASYMFVVKHDQTTSITYGEGAHVDLRIVLTDRNYKEPLHTVPESYGRKEETKGKLVFENGEWVLYSESKGSYNKASAISIVSHHVENCEVDIHIDYSLTGGERRHGPFSPGEHVIEILSKNIE